MNFLRVTKQIVAMTMVALFVVPTTLLVQPQEAAAQTSVAGLIQDGAVGVAGSLAACAASWGLGMVITFWTPILVGDNSGPTEARECFLDGLAWNFINVLIDTVVADMVVWIETGFEGAPAFISDPMGALVSAADYSIAQTILDADNGLGFLCEEFRLNVQIGLIGNYFKSPTDEFDCRLTDMLTNVQGALDGFIPEDGGWDAMFTMTTNRSNHPLYAGAMAEYYIDQALITKGGEEIKLWDWGDGFESSRWLDGSGDSFIGNPGKVIQAKAESVFNMQTDRLVIADDVNELLNALAQYFIQQMFTTERGLAGGSSYVSGSGIAAAPNESKQRLLDRIDEAIAEATAAGATDVVNELQQLRAEVETIDTNDPQLASLAITAGNAQLQAILAEYNLETSGGVGADGPPSTGLPDPPDPPPSNGTAGAA